MNQDEIISELLGHVQEARTRGDYETAVRDLEFAWRVAPGNIEGYFELRGTLEIEASLRDCAKEEMYWNRALEFFTEAIEAAPESWHGYKLRADTHFRYFDHLIEAAEDYTKALTVDSSIPDFERGECHLSRATIAAEGMFNDEFGLPEPECDFQAAIEAFLAAADHPRSKAMLLKSEQDLLACLHDSDESELALAVAAAALQRHPDDHYILFHQGVAFANLGRRDEAIHALTRAFKAGSDFPPENLLDLISDWLREARRVRDLPPVLSAAFEAAASLEAPIGYDFLARILSTVENFVGRYVDLPASTRTFCDDMLQGRLLWEDAEPQMYYRSLIMAALEAYLSAPGPVTASFVFVVSRCTSRKFALLAEG